MDNNQRVYSELSQERQQVPVWLRWLPSLLYDQLMIVIESRDFQKTYTELPTLAERVKFVLSQEIVQLVLGQYVVYYNAQQQQDGKKSVTQAIRDGIEGARADNYEDALSSYSSAIRYAPQDSSQLPIAFGNRSGAFYHLNKYEAALKDIEAAETHTKYKPFFMLTIRKCQCLIKLGLVGQAKKILDSIKREELNKSDNDLLDKFYDEEGEKLKDVDYRRSNKKDIEPELLKNLSSVIKILSEKGRFEPQSSNSSLSSKVEVRYDEKKGRHLVTTRQVHFGDILAVTQPYASALTEKQELFYCHHCLASLKFSEDLYPRSIPCTQCTRVLYCSEYCSTESWKLYHRFECPLPLYLLEQEFTEKILEVPDHRLVLRTWFIAGGLESIRAVIQKFDSTVNPSKNADFTEDSYENIYRMAMNEFDSIAEVVQMIIGMIFISHCSKLTEIGDADSNIAASEKDIQTIEALLRNYLQFYDNKAVFLRSDQSALDDQTVPYESFFTIDPLISLVRESCSPNISIIVVDSAQAAPHVSNVNVFFAIKPMPAGTVLTSVGPSGGDSVKYRIHLDQYLQWQQNFLNYTQPTHRCHCEHCEEKLRDSPFGSTSTLNDHELVCCGATCGGFIRRTDEGKVNCSACKRIIEPAELRELKKILKKMTKYNSEAIDLIYRAKTMIANYKQQENLPKELMTLLKQLEILINDRISPLALKHSRLLLVDLYKQLKTFYLYCNKMDESNHFAHLLMAWKYADASHTTLEAHHGGNSLTLLVLLQRNVQIFSNAFGLIGLELMDPVGPMVGDRYLQFHQNWNDDTEDEDRNARARFVKSVHKARKRLDCINAFYNMI